MEFRGGGGWRESGKEQTNLTSYTIACILDPVFKQ